MNDETACEKLSSSPFGHWETFLVGEYRDIQGCQGSQRKKEHMLMADCQIIWTDLSERFYSVLEWGIGTTKNMMNSEEEHCSDDDLGEEEEDNIEQQRSENDNRNRQISRDVSFDVAKKPERKGLMTMVQINPETYEMSFKCLPVLKKKKENHMLKKEEDNKREKNQQVNNKDTNNNKPYQKFFKSPFLPSLLIMGTSLKDFRLYDTVTQKIIFQTTAYPDTLPRPDNKKTLQTSSCNDFAMISQKYPLFLVHNTKDKVMPRIFMR
eukprot:g2704.t1